MNQLPQGPAQTVHKPRVRVLYILSQARGSMTQQDIVGRVNDLVTGTQEQSQWYVPDVISSNREKHLSLLSLGLIEERKISEGTSYKLTPEGRAIVKTFSEAEVKSAFDESESWKTSVYNKQRAS